MVELTGTLDGIGLPAIVRLLGELRETGVLRISSGTWQGELAFARGQLISAHFGDDRGLDALDACVLMLAQGDFAFVEGEPTPEPDLEVTAEELRQHLEARSEEHLGPTAALPSLDAVPSLAGEPAPSADQVVLDRMAVQVLLLVDGQRSVREIVGDRPLMPVLRNLDFLARQGLISIPAHTRPATATPSKRLSPRPRTSTVTPAPQAPTPTPAPTAVEDGILGVCPKLGFADDPPRHYSRPTALHRCYATDTASLVTSQEQRDLCLGGRYASCPRFQMALAPTPTVPPGVAARLALAGTMSVAGGDVLDVARGDERATPTVQVRPRRRAMRGPLLIAGGAVVGLLVVVGALMALPLLETRLVPAPATAVPAFAPVASPQAARTSAPLAIATLAVPPTAVPTLPPRPPTPTTPRLASNVLLDARFAGGAQKDWLDNQPFAGWRDGAYRLAARQATKFVAVAAPVSVPDNVLISATLRKTGGPPGGGYGLIVRNQQAEALNGINQSFDAYVFEAGDLGEFGVWRREGDRWVDLVPWTRSQAVRQGGSPNELSVRVAAGQLLLTINGIEVARVDDDVLAHGGVGVFAGGDNNEVALDRFTVQVPN
ncbi:MAG TPA: DUF4388 domain-containing protein [Chloroflexota bacterium]|nr:DUF4388 domain-containing protein [Chloroflexota bacterium]